MKITINGRSQEIDSALTIKALLEFLDLSAGPVVVELNKEAIFPRHYDTITVNEGDILEVITIAAGG